MATLKKSRDPILTTCLVQRTQSGGPSSKENSKSLVMKKKPFLRVAIKSKHLLRCQKLHNNLKTAMTYRIVIFTDEKTWTMQPVFINYNDQYIWSLEMFLRVMTSFPLQSAWLSHESGNF
ncbi:unnamed protein product [Lepeophtheirus salmonis]|uniref:(salmon louse) hypothetical protein n=1 Tax=Lepeophtheirus salmonis TaxID=72036 RepID=A0A7R8CR74_LEPSM|nr:unnamed protein product [Lepeophtheirus salmonis]CAF2900505.1 unnamed protein product [Lepeophtheirus salmonis]